LVTVTTSRRTILARRLRRTVIPATVTGLLALAAPASAAPPSQWEAPPPVSVLDFLLVLVIIPGALFAVIFLLSSLGSMVRSQSSYQPGLAWRNEPEWFGGPRGGLDKVDARPQVEAGEAPERGGASGRW
jgi:hypothetical protein